MKDYSLSIVSVAKLRWRGFNKYAKHILMV